MASKNTSEYQLLIKLGAQVDKSVDSAIGKLTKKLGGLAILKIAKDAAVATGKAVLGYAKDSLEAYSTLEKSVVNAANVFGGTAEQVEANEDAIEKFSRGLAKRLPYSADQAADSLYYLGLVGIDLQDALDGAEQGLSVADKMMELAYVNGNDVATTVDLITDAMSGLNKEINKENVTDFMDLLTKTMSSTNTNADQMLNAILGVGQTAGMVNMGEDELAAYIGLLANYGTKDTQAGTALNSMFTRMIGNSTAIKAYKSLGVQMYDSSGGFKGVTSVLTQTEEALSKLTDEERNPIMKDLFGIHYMNEANILLGAMDEKTDELGNKTSEYADILATVSDNAGSLDQMVENSLDTLDSQYTIFKNQWTDLKYTLGKALEPAAVETLKWVNSTFFPQAEDTMEGIAGWIESQVPMIPEYLDTAYGYVTDAVEVAREYFSGQEWADLVEQGISFGGTLKDAFLSIDWPQVAETAGALGKAAANLVSFVLKIANSETVKFLTGILGNIINATAYVVEKITGGVNDFANWMKTWDFSQFGGENKEVVSDFTDRAAEAQVEVDNLNEQIKYYQDLISEETDPKVIDRLSAQVDTLNDRLKEAQDRLVALTDTAENIGGTYFATNSAGGALGLGGTKTHSSLSNKGSKGYKQYESYAAEPFADGGIVTRPTLSLIGEAGEKEAVIPLSKIGDVVSSVSGGNVTFAPVINVSGGNAGEGVRQALKSGYEEFKAYYKRMVKEQKRLAF